MTIKYLMISKKVSSKIYLLQGYNGRKVISEMYPSFELQCTVSGR